MLSPASQSYRLLQPLTDRARAAVAEELGCSASNVALVDNATQGIRLLIAALLVHRNPVTSQQAFALYCSMHKCLPSPPAPHRAASHSTMYYTQLMHEGRWQSGAVVIMTSTTYNAVKHAIR